MSGTRLVELSHTIEHGLETYRGLPAPTVCDFWSRESTRGRYAPGVEFHIGRIDLVGNTGTYIDAPFHRYADGADIAGLALERTADLVGVVVRARDVRAIDAGAIDARALDERELAGAAVLFDTGWSRHWRTEAYFTGHPYLTAAAAERLVALGVALVGIDSLNIDDTADLARPVHSILLAAGIPIVEHLTGLMALPDAGFRFFASPAKVRGLGSFPVRAFARVPDRPIEAGDRRNQDS
ncbi:MAG: cyclase family protein [Planctomycetes bacterium]|nr:cyclase family protein [Planctomycetota bacterium]